MEQISFASGATYFNTPAAASEAAIQAIRQNQTFYGPTAGTPALRKAIANRYQQYNSISISPENILITPGTKQALFNVAHTLLKPGDEVIIPAPNWFGLHEVLEQVGAKLVILPTSMKDNYAIPPEVLRRYISPRTRLFLYSNPNNPTGRIYSKSEISSWLEVIASFPDVYVLADEIYDLVVYNNKVPSLLEFPDENQKHVVVNGFSKAFAMSGWRIGYLVTPAALFEPCLHFQGATLSGISEFVQAAAQAAIEQASSILPDFLQILQQNKDKMSQVFTRSKIHFLSPQAAYYLFPDLSAFLHSEINTTLKLVSFLKENYALEIMPGEYFGAPGFARFSFALAPEKLEMGLDRLQRTLQTLA